MASKDKEQLMRCNRCGMAVPQWLWIGDDHPTIVDDGGVLITRSDNVADNTMTVRAEKKISVTMCSEVRRVSKPDFVDIGPECFTDRDGLVINYKGENFYKACGKFVKGRLDGGTTTCVKRVNHKNDCEDYDGDTR